jgi:plastocyanin
MSTSDQTQAPPASSPSGFTLLVATMALILSLVAVLAVAFRMHDSSSSAGGHYASSMMNGSTVHGSMMGGTAGAAVVGGGAEEINVVIKSDEEHARRGPEGTWHDAFLPADFTVQPGATVKVTFLNYDEGEHSFTSMPLGLNVKIPAGSAGHPKATSFTFRAPDHRGTYPWWCAMPCDPWAMSHVGYMRGYVRVA